ncbi:MAG: cytochrome c [Candidatus Eremiobacteraeota bacterium]|nr:cytochrome c [Candidatus Eremiobacteraeota bacterium]
MLKRFLIPVLAGVAVAAFTLTSEHTVRAAASDGKAIYDGKCASCHQANGQGLASTFPPLAGNKDVTGDPTKVITSVVKGVNGSITVNGKSYNGAMPAWRGQLSDADIAAVVTYIRSSWGNKASAVTEKQVAAVK